MRQSEGPRRWWWLGALLVVASLVVGGTVAHTVDQRHAQRVLYDSQVLTTASRFLHEERVQIALPVAQRNAGAFDDPADSIDADLGVNGAGTLEVTPGTDSAAPSRRSLSSHGVAVRPTTFASGLSGGGVRGMNSQNAYACAVSSLLGSGRATSFLDLGASASAVLALWSASSKNPDAAPRSGGHPATGPG